MVISKENTEHRNQNTDKAQMIKTQNTKEYGRLNSLGFWTLGFIWVLCGLGFGSLER